MKYVDKKLELGKIPVGLHCSATTHDVSVELMKNVENEGVFHMDAWNSFNSYMRTHETKPCTDLGLIWSVHFSWDPYGKLILKDHSQEIKHGILWIFLESALKTTFWAKNLAVTHDLENIRVLIFHRYIYWFYWFDFQSDDGYRVPKGHVSYCISPIKKT